MHRKVAGALVALALALGGAAGCGGGDKPLTKAEFVKQANAACKPAPSKSTTTAKRSRGPEGFITQILAQQQKITAGLDGINAPAELDSEFATLKKAMHDRVAMVEKALETVKANPKARLDDFGKQAEGIQKQLTAASTALHVKNCT